MKLFAKLIAAAFILIALAVGGLLLLPAERLGRIAADQLSAQLGRNVALESARISIVPTFGISVDDLRVANADWAGGEAMLEARRVTFGLDPLGAIAGRVTLRSAVIDAPVLRLATDAQGRANWQLDPKPDTGSRQLDEQQTGSGKNTLPPISFDQITLRDGTILFSAPDGNTQIEGLDLMLGWPDPTGPMTSKVSFSLNGSPVTVMAEIAAPEALLQGDASALAARIDTTAGPIKFDGMFAASPSAEGVVTLDLSNTPELLASFGVNMAPGVGNRIIGSADLTLADAGNTFTIRQGVFKLDDTDIALTMEGNLSAKPRITATIETGALDLAAFTNNAPGAEGIDDKSDDVSSDQSAEGWQTAPIDASALGAFDADIRFSAEGIDLGDVIFGRTQGKLMLEDSRAVLTLDELAVYDGLVTGQLVLNNRNGFSARADLSLAQVALQEALGDTLGVNRFEGPVSANLSLLSAGASIDALMRALEGTGDLMAGPGVINGFNLDAALEKTTAGGTTLFQAATATFVIDDGILTNNDLSLDLLRLAGSGRGIVDIGAQGIDYTLSVNYPEARGGRGAVLPVNLKGPWTDVSIRLDTAALLEQNLAQERDQLQQSLRERAAEELGVTPQDGENTQDALRRQLEERAKDGLLKLFDR